MTKKVIPSVLVVDDEVEVGRFFDVFLTEEKGCRVTVANSGRIARELFSKTAFDLAFVDLRLPDASGIDLLTEIRAREPHCRVVIMTGHSTVKSAVEAIRLGAFDYVEKPFDELDELEKTVDRAVGAIESAGRPSRGAAQPLADFNIVLGPNSPLNPVLEVAAKIAKKNLTVLIHGPTGAGKEVLARFIHANSLRATRPFIAVNCGAFAETLLESELFGHEKGAFTGAVSARRGIFEVADGGTLFLDEIGEATPAIQVKLLRTLETGEFTRVGGDRPLKSDVRIVAATNVELRQAVQRGAFRKDLFYRLDVVSLDVPPLRERPSDVEALMGHFVDKALPTAERGTVSFSPRARAALLRYDWPGNVREMANVVARAMALREGNVLDLDMLPGKIGAGVVGAPPSPGAASPPGLQAESISALGERLFASAVSGPTSGLEEVVETLKQIEHRVVSKVVERALAETGGSGTAAAALLGVSPRILRYYLRERRGSKE